MKEEVFGLALRKISLVISRFTTAEVRALLLHSLAHAAKVAISA